MGNYVLQKGANLNRAVWTHVKQLGRGDLYRNGASVATDTSFTEPNELSAGGIIIGARWYTGAAQLPFIGAISDLAFYTRALTAPERAAVEGEAKALYGVTW
jgi:hypothetical protein